MSNPGVAVIRALVHDLLLWSVTQGRIASVTPSGDDLVVTLEDGTRVALTARLLGERPRLRETGD